MEVLGLAQRKLRWLLQTSQPDACAAGLAPYVVGHSALVLSGIVLLQLQHMQRGRAAATDHAILAALLQGASVFVPVDLQRG